jgi:hypothetical protein
VEFLSGWASDLEQRRRNALDAKWHRIHKQPKKRDTHHKSKNQYQSDISARIVYYREHSVNSLAY